MKIRFYLVGIALLAFFHVNLATAQTKNLKIYPKVQELTQKGEAFEFHGFHLKNAKKWKALVKRTPVQKMLTSSKKGLSLKLALKKDIAAEHNEHNLAKADGAYELTVDKKEATLYAIDSLGLFYGLQTLRQLVNDSKIVPIKIEDFPTVAYRGVVEGFYGTPWSQAARISQIEFYGRNKANTYIYGPKDDPYHSSPNWRKPYPADQAENIKKLVQVANANFVDFVWAIHPGQDIKWTDEDRDNVLKKFEAMYDLGVRSFAIFFDDISGEGTDAHKQAGLLNYLTDHFVKVKKGVKPLILTPTDYNKSWANPDPDKSYLAILGRELDPSVQIMWTGDNVMSDVTKSTLDWVQKRIQRPALVWWNFPVSDYARNNLFIGPSYGLEDGIDATEMSGILSNPMEHAEASKPGIFGVLDYGWNTENYQAEKVWVDYLRKLLPHSYKAYKLFGENNSNPNHGISSYVGKESKTIAPYLKRIEEGVKAGEVSEKDFIFAEGYFYNIKNAAHKILEANDDSALIKEVKPWLHNFTELGQEGLNQLENYKYQSLSADKYWIHIDSGLQTSKYWTPQAFKAGDGTETTAITGPAVLKPFVTFLQKWNAQKLFEKITGEDKARSQNEALGTTNSNIKDWKGGRFIVVDEKEVALVPQQKSLKFEKGKYVTMVLSTAIEKGEIAVQYKSKEKAKIQLEVSKNGETWTKIEGKEEKGILKASANQAFKYVRITQSSNENSSFELSKVSVKKTGNQFGNQPFTTHDFDLLTTYNLKAGKTLTESSTRVSQPEKAIILTDNAQGNLQIKVEKDGTWQVVSPSQKGKYIVVDLPEGNSKIQITAQQDILVYEVLWE